MSVWHPALSRRRRRSGGGGSSALVSDTFTRANSALTMGNAETGQAWEAIAGVWGIDTGQAYHTTAGSDRWAVVDAGVANCTIQATLAVTSNDVGLAFRLTDATNLIRLINEGGTLYLQKIVAGSIVTLDTAAGDWVNGDVIKAVLAGNSIKCYLNGVETHDATESFNNTATKHGLAGNASTARWDDFTVTA